MTTQHLRVASPPADLQVAIYARVSSDQQAERHTIDSQIAELKARALQDGYQVREDMLFIDNGHSGASLIRPALERLRDLIAFSAVDVVYVHAPDRLARSYAHQVLLLEEFSRAGAQVVFLNRPIGDTPEDSLLLQLQGMFAEYERAKVLERSRRGKRHRAQAGAVSVLARAPFGYRYITREAGGGAARYEIDENAARIVRQIFTWVGHERLTLAAVCRRLLNQGVPSPAGQRHWSRATIHTMLLNPASHEGIPVKLFLHLRLRSRLSAVAHFNFRPRWSSRHGRALPCEPHIRRDDVPTTVPHSGRESSRRAAPLYETAAFAPGRTTATPPWIPLPAPLGGTGSTHKINQDTGFVTAPSGTTPWVANRHKAIRSRRAIATTMTLRMRFPVPPTRSRNQMT